MRTIDKLWLEYSKRKFGFSVQKEIYQNLGGTKEYNKEIWRNFSDRVGWRKEGNWVNYNDLAFNLNAPFGQLPAAFMDIWPEFNADLSHSGKAVLLSHKCL